MAYFAARFRPQEAKPLVVGPFATEQQAEEAAELLLGASVRGRLGPEAALAGLERGQPGVVVLRAEDRKQAKSRVREQLAQQRRLRRRKPRERAVGESR